MATELIQRRWCDWHLREKDERVAASAWRGTFGPADSTEEPMVMDLCPECVDRFAGPLGELMDILQAKRQGDRTHEGTHKMPRYDCPMCSETLGKSGLKHHFEREHGYTLGQMALRVGRALEGGDIRFVCRDCDSGFHRGQAYAQHRIAKHGDKAPLDIEAGSVTPAEVAQIRQRVLAAV